MKKLGHDAHTSKFVMSFMGKNNDEKEQIKLRQKYQEDAIRQDCEWVKDMDALLVAIYDKDGIKNYIGGNAFIEMAYAYILGKPLYLLYPVPNMPYYGTELIAMKPMVINSNLSRIKSAEH